MTRIRTAAALSVPLGSPLFIPGTPAPQGSKRHVGRGILVESSKADCHEIRVPVDLSRKEV